MFTLKDKANRRNRLGLLLTLLMALLAVGLTASVALASNASSATGQTKGQVHSQGVPQNHGSGGQVSSARLSNPAAPNVVLYDQYDSAGTTATSSQDFEPAYAAYTDQTADDFVVPTGQNWQVNEVDFAGQYYNGAGPSASFNVYFYQNSGTLPATPVYTATNLSYTNSAGDFVVALTSPATLAGGATYWVSVQARMDYSSGGQFGWTDRTVQSNSAAAFRNPGGGFACNPEWAPKNPCVTGSPPDQVYRLVGDVVSQGTPTNTATGTPPTATPTVTPTETPCGTQGGWSAGASFPTVMIRAWGAYFPANGKFYSMGGRTSDSAGSDILNPYEYDPAANTWTMKSATFPDNQNNNMVGGVLTVGGTPMIVVVGGSAAGATTASAQVKEYNPATDTMSVLTAADNWPGNASGTVLPGGAAVYNNKLYIFGGFDINVAMTNQIWEFDPNGAVGAKWTQKTNLPQQLGYVPAATIGNFIYTAGGSMWDGTTLQDTNYTFKYDPATDTITAEADTINPTAETRAVNFNGQLWVLGGGRTAPNPSNQVQVYDPATNTWTLGTTFVNARRNFPADTNGTSKIWLVGGYAPSSATDSMEIYTAGVPCEPTSTPTSTTVPGTPTNTATPCVITFTDVHPTDYFYQAVTYLYCHGVISGYADNTFRPYNNTTRGQMAKIVVLGFAIPIWTPSPSATPTFTDVLPNNAFYEYIETAAHNNIVSGYADGTYRPFNNVTRGQLSKIIVIGAVFSYGWQLLNPPTPTFSDVPPNSPFYTYIETAYCHQIISGYADGTFRPGADATRGQISKIEYNAILNLDVCAGTTPTAVVTGTAGPSAPSSK